ncbi:MAG: thioredoxin domain-containing protein [Pyrinomonadaceae bacterium]
MKKGEMKKDDAMKKDGAMMKDDGMKKDDAMMKDDKMMKDDGMMAMAKFDESKPTVAIIRADWCPYCKKVEPVVADLKKEYGDKFNFVVFDVTDDKATAESKAHAKEIGMTEFFDDFKGKTSAVAVLKENKVVYKTFNNGKHEEYVKAFDKALK